MAIEKRYNEKLFGRHPYYALVCDQCGDEAGHFDDFYEAVEEKKNYGYRSVNINGEWLDICESCQDMAQYKKGTATAADDFAGIV